MFGIGKTGEMYCIYEESTAVILIENITSEQLAQDIKSQLVKTYDIGFKHGKNDGLNRGKEETFDFFFPF